MSFQVGAGFAFCPLARLSLERERAAFAQSAKNKRNAQKRF